MIDWSGLRDGGPRPVGGPDPIGTPHVNPHVGNGAMGPHQPPDGPSRWAPTGAAAPPPAAPPPVLGPPPLVCPYPPAPRRSRKPLIVSLCAGGAVIVVVAIVLAITLAGGPGSGSAAPPVAQPPHSAGAPTSPPADAAATCQPVDAPLMPIDAKAHSEPRLLIPQPPGWRRFTDMDSQLVRFFLVNRSLIANSFAPNAGVILEEHDGRSDPHTVFDAERNTLIQRGGATNVSTSDTTVCGYPAQTVNYTAAPVGNVPSRPATALVVVVPAEQKTFAVTLTVQTTDADNPTYQHDAQTILHGFQVLPPANADHG